MQASWGSCVAELARKGETLFEKGTRLGEPPLLPGDAGEVGERRGASVRPMPNVVALDEPPVRAGESTATIPVLQRPA